ncbi:MAG: rhodanese-like domain-containing protein [Verrucomicrobiota bacterium]
MRTMFLSGILAALILPLLAEQEMPNPAIDYAEFARLTNELAPVREKNRVTEEQFIKMAAEPGTIVLDARTRGWFERIHVKGARHLALTDFTADALQKVMPDKNMRILIYCNNNFENEPEGFARKTRSVSLNIQTFINLHAYGYRNVYELGPLLDVNTTKIPLVRNINLTPLPKAQVRPTWQPVPAPE